VQAVGLQDGTKLVLPLDGTPLLPSYEGAYSRAFVALHPFFTVEGLDPAACTYGTLVLSAPDKPDDVDMLGWAERERAAQAHGKELKGGSVDEIAKRFGQPVRWRAICDEVGFPDHRDLNRALLTHIQALNHGYSDPDGADLLERHCADHRIFLPTEGAFQAVMERAYVELLRRAGVEQVYFSDEFGDEAQLVRVDDLATDGAWDLPPLRFQPRQIFSEDRSLFITVHWDSFFAVIFGTDERLSFRLDDLFEGFWCSDETTIGWSFEPHIPLNV
jgi:hypothetical protein